MFTDALRLHNFFKSTDVVALNQEQWAGMFECVIGALEKGGRTTLVNAILRWCATTVLLASLRPEILRAVFRPWSQDPMATLPVALPHSIRRFMDTDIHILQQTTHSWIESSLREAGGCLILSIPAPVPVESPTQTSVLRHDSHTGLVCLELRCYESGCNQEDHTNWRRWSGECYEEATNMGWKTPSTKSWKHARCPRHSRW